MAQASLDVGDVGFKLGRDGGSAESPVEEADCVGFVLQNLNNRVGFQKSAWPMSCSDEPRSAVEHDDQPCPSACST
jgi:hypothetical protein